MDWAHYQYKNTKIRNHPIIFVVSYFIEHNANKYFNFCVKKKAWLLKITYWSMYSNIICRLLFPGHFVYMKTVVYYNIYSLIFTFQYDTRRRARKKKHTVKTWRNLPTEKLQPINVCHIEPMKHFESNEMLICSIRQKYIQVYEICTHYQLLESNARSNVCLFVCVYCIDRCASLAFVWKRQNTDNPT